MTIKHTKLPWVYDRESDTIRVKSYDNDFMGDYRGCVIAGFEQSHGGQHRRETIPGLAEAVEANAAFITHSCNTYYQREQALKACVEALEKARLATDYAEARLLTIDNTNSPQIPPNDDILPTIGEANKHVRDALAQAREVLK